MSRRIFIICWILCLLLVVGIGACKDDACIAGFLHHVRTGFDVPYQVLVLGYLTVTTLAIGLYLPGGLPLVVIAGALFPFAHAMLWASLGNALGATLGCWLARTLFRPIVEKRYSNKIKPMQDGFLKHGHLYLLLLRLLPLAPSPLVNAAVALSHYALLPYFVITFVGRLPITWVYVSLANQWLNAESWRELMEGDWLVGLIALLMLSWFARLWWRRDGQES